MRKGIILAGGSGTRLYPITKSVSKQLLPVYDKPMVYYPLSTLMLAGIREVLIITTPQDQTLFQNLLGDGSQFGIQLQYAVQPNPGGLAQAFLIGREFVGSQPSTLILGDNIFFGHGLDGYLKRADGQKDGATVFGYWVSDPELYGNVAFDGKGNVIAIEEKPEHPKSQYAITGLYFYDGTVCDRAAALKPSARGELEITDLNRSYLNDGKLRVEKLGRGYAWLDTGSHESLAQASEYIRTVEQRQGLKIACLEEVAYQMGYIDAEQVGRLAEPLQKSGYGNYLLQMLEREEKPA